MADKKKIKIGATTIREIRDGYFLADLVMDNKRVRKCFKTLADAKLWAGERKLELKNQGTASLGISEGTRVEVADLLQRLNGRASLSTCVKYWLKHNPDGTSETWDETCKRYLEYMERYNCRPASISDKQVKTSVLGTMLGNPRTVTVDLPLLQKTIEKESPKYKWSTGTELAYLNAGKTIISFFNGENRKHREKDEEAPLTWDADTITNMIKFAEDEAPNIVPALAVMTWGGLRPNEALRLSWDCINFDEDLICLKGAMTKTRNARNVEISDNLKEWLLAYKKEGGLLVSSAITFKRGRDKVKEKMKLTEWPADVLRHTCATYNYARSNNIHLTASQLGHFDTGTFLKFYKGNPPKQAEVAKFWDIKPTVKTNRKAVAV
jgi:integrase